MRLSEPLTRFLRGLGIGALVGAAIAGSRIWRGHRGRSSVGPSGRKRAGPSEDRRRG